MRKNADQLLNIWYHKANEMEKLHNEAYHYYKNNDAFITIPTIIISSIAGSINFVSVGFCSKEKNMYYSLAAGCLNILATIMGTIKQYFSWSSKYYKHNATSIAYLKVKNLIEIQLSLHKFGLNMPYEQIIPEIGKIITKIDDEAPPLPSHISSKVSNSKIIAMDIIMNSDTDEINNKKDNTSESELVPLVISEDNIIDEYSNINTDTILNTQINSTFITDTSDDINDKNNINDINDSFV